MNQRQRFGQALIQHRRKQAYAAQVLLDATTIADTSKLPHKRSTTESLPKRGADASTITNSSNRVRIDPAWGCRITIPAGSVCRQEFWRSPSNFAADETGFAFLPSGHARSAVSAGKSSALYDRKCRAAAAKAEPNLRHPAAKAQA